MQSRAAWVLRILAGLAAAPVAAALISVGMYDLFWHAGVMPYGGPPHSVDAAVALGAGVFILAVVVTGAAALGVFWLNDRRWRTLGRVLAFGAVIGNLPLALIVVVVVVARPDGALTGDWYGVSGMLVRIAMSVVAGAGGAAAFWLVSVRGTLS